MRPEGYMEILFQDSDPPKLRNSFFYIEEIGEECKGIFKNQKLF